MTSRYLNFQRFIIFILCFAIFRSSAQKKVVRGFADLPVLIYSTLPLQTENEDSINIWMWYFAGREIVHIDSIYKECSIENADLNYQLASCRAYYSYLLGNYSNMGLSDDIVTKCTLFPVVYKKTGAVDLNAYVKAIQNPQKEFIKSYQLYYENALQTLTDQEKLEVTDYILNRLQGSKPQFEIALHEIRKKTSSADTALMFMVRNYARIKMIPELEGYLLNYLRQVFKYAFTFADTLRGSLLPNRSWWDVLRYDITIRPDYTTKTITGENEIVYKVVKAGHPDTIQIDLQEPLEIDSIFFNRNRRLYFRKDGNAWFVSVPHQEKEKTNSLLVFYHGRVHEAINPPWDGGWIWGKDTLGNPWMSVTCEVIGASIWFPCKDHLSDEPDLGTSLTMIVPDTLMAIANGRMISKKNNGDGTTSYKWAVINPINNYDIIPYIGKYVHFNERYPGLKGNLDLDFWVMGYNLDRAKKYMPAEVTKMLKAFESWYGPYPFYEDGYKLIEAPSIGGMEHQSAVSYGFGIYKPGFIGGRNLSGTPWGEKWDYMIVHESGHEWFGNSITCKDLADMWIHEGFTCFSETLYTDYWFGSSAGNEYNLGLRKQILNRYPVIGFYGVNDHIAGRNPDIYPKGSAMLQTLRHSMGEEKFKLVLKNLNTRFYHQTVTTAEIEKEISRVAGFDYNAVFDQYLRNISIPTFEYYFAPDKKTVSFRYSNCIAGFNLPLTLKNDSASTMISPNTEWQQISIGADQAGLFDAQSIENWYYLKSKLYTKQPA
jgi:Peptidase family M1 domain